MARSSVPAAVILRESLGDLLEVGRGGFGRVCKARHKVWGFDVAVKIFKRDASQVESKEASFMELASCEFVLRVYGVYQGLSGEQGLVMEYMKRGSIDSLKEQLSGPPPWPLAFRLAHQSALAMNFLHNKNIVHLDLKPSNVLLTDELHVKLADFGLSTVSRSFSVSGRDSHTGPQGTFKYMPPEAFDLNYRPVRPFDVYSFGILLWSIFTGKEPYPEKDYSLVELRIREGDRPRCEGLLSLQVDGIKDLVALMTSCWDRDPKRRPHFNEIINITEKLLLRHSNEIQPAVHSILMKLDSPNQTQQNSLEPLNEPQVVSQRNDVMDHKSIREMTQASSNSGSRRTLSRKEKAKFVDDHRATLIQRVSRALTIAEELGDMVHSETYSTIRGKTTAHDQLRVLYSNTLWSGGERVKAAFYDALEKHEPFLMDELEN